MDIRRKTLLSQIANGNLDAFEKFYNENVKLVYGYLKLRLKDDSGLNDILQETFLAIWKNCKQYNETSKATSWIIGIARNKMMDIMRVRYRNKEDSLYADNTLEYAEDDFSESLLERVNVQNALRFLCEDSRELLYMVYSAGMSYKEVANILHIPEGTVKSRMHNIKNVIKKKLV